MTLILASRSAARAALLMGAGVPHETAESHVDEDAAKTRLLAQGATPARVAQALADEKALAVSSVRPGRLILGADQTLEFQGRLHDKAADLDAARLRLQALRGHAHHLHSAASLARDGQVIWRQMLSATLIMRRFSDAFLERYLETEGPQALGSVGCYRLEGQGAQLFEAVDGDYFAILGLPLLGVLERLRQDGLILA